MSKTISRALKIWFGICFLLVAATVDGLCREPKSTPEPVKIKLSHIGLPTWSIYEEVIEPWINNIVTLTQGQVNFQVFSGDQLGEEQTTVDIITSGKVDISSSVCDYTPGRFPLTSVMKLPFLGESGEIASLILWSVYTEFLQDEYKDFKVIALFCHGPGHIHTINKEVKSLEDLKGLRIRVADRVLGNVLTQLGAIPVISTVDQTRTLVENNMIDGFALPWEGLTSFNLMDSVQYHTEVNMYTLPLYILMNKKKYESLPDDIKQIIDKTSGESLSVFAGYVFDQKDHEARRIAIEKGHTIDVLDKDELRRWRNLTMKIGDQWIDEMHEKGLPGRHVLSYVINLYFQLK